ncbi:hypothetical protein [Estrella lausannensis]|uniref:Putative secreted protein n=1 Tax=Estrella lausannensis TaxID=483423 RepID=A0A0H5DN66_9BACT|nr:hypothetical protein [Estrella lausannensis]CRX37701.1 putative secreted protein [Estrella lausannensis]
MNKAIYKIFACLLLVCSAQVFGEPLRITTTQISPKEALSTKKYKHLAATSPGHYKTLIFFEEAKEGEPYSITIDRTALKELKIPGVKVMHWLYIGAGLHQLDGMKAPFYILSSRGYLPGESVVVEVKNYDETFKHSFKCIPYPIEKSSKEDSAVIRVELVDLRGGIYKVSFDGFKEGEEVRTISFSEGEEIRGSTKIMPGAATYLMPAVEGKNGGMEIFTVQRSNGEKLTIGFPWGINLLPSLEYSSRPKAYSNFIN